jgi:murein DD-endopeptidase MepM/ murein hydrolase activator NlpD
MRIVYPLPPNKGANRVDAGFLDPNYPIWRKNVGLSPDEHPGADFNVSGTSGDGDLRYPVIAVMPMKIIHAGFHRVWGNIVLGEVSNTIAKEFGFPLLHVQYAHLNDMLVKEGDVVYPGEVIGTIGKGDPTRPFLAHLHLEMRIQSLPPDNWPKTKQNIVGKYIDPVEFLDKNASYERRFKYISYRVIEDKSLNGAIVNQNDLDFVWIRVQKL